MEIKQLRRLAHLLIVTVALVGCGPSTEQIGQTVKASMQQSFDSDPQFKDLHLAAESVIVVKDSGNTYQGIAKVRSGDQSHDIPVKITADGKNVMWQTEPGAFLSFSLANVQRSLAAIPGLTTEPPPAAPTALAAPSVPDQSGVLGNQGQPATTGPLVQQQAFSGHWQAIYGKVELTNTSWTNNSNAAMQSATLECDQYAANGSNLSQNTMTLNGPVQAGGTVTFNSFQMGTVSEYSTKVNCGIVAVTPAD